MTTKSVEFPRIVGKTEITGIADDFIFEKGEGKKKKTGSAATDVTDLFIPDTYTYIGKNALHGCRNGVKIHVSSLTQWLKIQPADSYSLPEKYQLIVAGQKITELVVPGDCESINDHLFAGVSGIKNVVIQNGVKKIGNKTFCNCSDLQSIHISSSISFVGFSAFEGCEKLKEVYLEDIGTWTDAVVLSSPFQSGATLFVGEKQCTKLVIPEFTERIRKAAFKGCRGITEIDISNTVRFIEPFAFSECTDLRLVMIPESVESIGELAFSKCQTTVVCNTLFSQMLPAFPFGTLIYARAKADVMKDQQYRIRPLRCFNRETISDESGNSLKGLVFAVTGDIEAFPERDGLIEYIQTCGGQYSSSITKKTTHLITNQRSAQTTKHVKAKQLDLPIVSETEFFKMAFPEREKDLQTGYDTNEDIINDIPERKGNTPGEKDSAIYLLDVEIECKNISSLDKWFDEISNRKLKEWKKELRDHFYAPAERLLIKDLTFDNLHLLEEKIKSVHYSYVINSITREKAILDMALESIDRDEKVMFMDKHFVTTGFGENEESAADQIRKRGGFFHDKMVKDTDYLVISFDDPGLTKLQKALKMRKEGSGVKIVCDFQFWQALLDSSNRVMSYRELQIREEEREKKLEEK